jgi:hypothetical protein
MDNFDKQTPDPFATDGPDVEWYEIPSETTADLDVMRGLTADKVRALRKLLPQGGDFPLQGFLVPTKVAVTADEKSTIITSQKTIDGSVPEVTQYVFDEQGRAQEQSTVSQQLSIQGLLNALMRQYGESD